MLSAPESLYFFQSSSIIIQQLLLSLADLHMEQKNRFSLLLSLFSVVLIVALISSRDEQSIDDESEHDKDKVWNKLDESREKKSKRFSLCWLGNV